MKKYALLREYLLNKNILSIDELSLSPLCSIEDLLYAHDASYITEIKNIPITLNLGGGYADPIELSVEAYANTYRVAKEIYF
jgi:hypothetical protein